MQHRCVSNRNIGLYWVSITKGMQCDFLNVINLKQLLNPNKDLHLYHNYISMMIIIINYMCLGTRKPWERCCLFLAHRNFFWRHYDHMKKPKKLVIPNYGKYIRVVILLWTECLLSLWRMISLFHTQPVTVLLNPSAA